MQCFQIHCPQFFVTQTFVYFGILEILFIKLLKMLKLQNAVSTEFLDIDFLETSTIVKDFI